VDTLKTFPDLYQHAYAQERHHFAQLVATGLETHREKMEYWRSQRHKLEAQWKAIDVPRTGRHKETRSQKSDDQDLNQRRPESQERANVPNAPPCAERHLKVYPDLGAACLRERLDLPYRLWLLLRQEQPNGRGWLTEDHVFSLSCGSRRETKRWLRAGLGMFWHWYEDRLHLHGLEAVSEALGVPPEKHAAHVPMAEIESLQGFRAVIYAAWFVKPVTISQAKLSEIFGRKPKTLQRWAKLTGLEIGHNLAWTPLADEEDLQKKAASVKAKYYWTEQLKWIPGKPHKRGDKPDDIVGLFWIQPNTYRSPYQRAPKTRLQRHACQALSKLRPTSRAPGQRVYCPRGPGQLRQATRLLESGGIAMVEEARSRHDYGLFRYMATEV
jgi:hypothetical protein